MLYHFIVDDPHAIKIKRCNYYLFISYNRTGLHINFFEHVLQLQMVALWNLHLQPHAELIGCVYYHNILIEQLLFMYVFRWWYNNNYLLFQMSMAYNKFFILNLMVLKYSFQSSAQAQMLHFFDKKIMSEQ